MQGSIWKARGGRREWLLARKMWGLSQQVLRGLAFSDAQPSQGQDPGFGVYLATSHRCRRLLVASGPPSVYLPAPDHPAPHCQMAAEHPPRLKNPQALKPINQVRIHLSDGSPCPTCLTSRPTLHMQSLLQLYLFISTLILFLSPFCLAGMPSLLFF